MYSSLKRKVDETFFAPASSSLKKANVSDFSSQANSIQKQRNSLPIAAAKSRFLEQAGKHDSFVLIGETGSGKTTQIPQFLLEGNLNRPGKCIGVTQPRRVAAISLAHRVNEEMASSNQVGYRVRFEDTTSSETKIIYQTDGMLLREAMLDPMLNKYSWIILDEAHERSVATDILFGVIKTAQDQRKRVSNDVLKVIVMSATMDAARFSEYFRKCPILYVIGRQHAVNIRHVTEPVDEYCNAVVQSILKLHYEAPGKEDILAFLTGQEEIESTANELRNCLQVSNRPCPRGIVMPLYAAQQFSAQQKIFTASKEGTRKIILATNIAETSLTIPGVKHVIDSCRVKAKVHQASTGLDILRVVKISQSQAWQRAGRAGRISEGTCYRMLTRQEFERLDKDTVPEIKRCSISTVLLQMLSIGIKDVAKFDFLDPPPKDAILGALRQLKLLGAIDMTEDSTEATLTEIGRKMAAFPLDPKFTKAILAAHELGCTEEVITIVSMLTGDSPIVTPAGKERRDEANDSRKQFTSSEGDHITLLKIYRAFSKTGNDKEFCQAHYLHRRHLQFSVEVRKQLMDLCSRNGIKVQSCANNTEFVRKALAIGMFTNVARLTREGHYVTLDSKQKVQIHPSSVMFKNKPELVIFTELIATQKSWIRTLSLVDANWLMDAQPAYFRQHRIVQNS